LKLADLTENSPVSPSSNGMAQLDNGGRAARERAEEASKPKTAGASPL
jgi:hypothetical protein